MTDRNPDFDRPRKKINSSTLGFSKHLLNLPLKSIKYLPDTKENGQDARGVGDGFRRFDGNALFIPHLTITVSISIHSNTAEHWSNLLPQHWNGHLHYKLH